MKNHYCLTKDFVVVGQYLINNLLISFILFTLYSYKRQL